MESILHTKKMGMKTDMENRVKNDLYLTPPQFTQSLLDLEKFSGTIHEPSCGRLDMVKVFSKSYTTTFSDINFDHGGVDFLNTNEEHDNIVTNPPFCLANEFIEKAVVLARFKVALLLSVPYLASIKRKEIFERTRLTRVHMFMKLEKDNGSSYSS